MLNRKFTAHELREWSAQCQRSSMDSNISAGEREQLLKMQKALLDLASIDDWLNGNADPLVREYNSLEDKTSPKQG